MASLFLSHSSTKVVSWKSKCVSILGCALICFKECPNCSWEALVPPEEEAAPSGWSCSCASPGGTVTEHAVLDGVIVKSWREGGS